MHILKKYVVFDAADIDREATFWASILGGTVGNVENFDPGSWRDVIVDGQVALAVQHAPDHQAPNWPPRDDADQRQQAHYDLIVERDAVEAAKEEALGLGATLLREAPDTTVGHGFHVFADPEGHPFCICWG